MASLATCIQKASKALNGGDAKAVREIYNDYLAAEMPAGEAAETAVADYLGILGDERADITGQITEAGGEAPGTDDVAYARVRSVEMDIADKLRVDGIIDGRDPPLTDTSKKTLSATLAMMMDARVRAANRGRTLEAQTTRNKEIVSSGIADEVEAAAKRGNNAGAWYHESIDNTTAIAELIYPELSDPNQRSMFYAALATTSQETDVPVNAKFADKAFAAYVKSNKDPAKRRFPTNLQYGHRTIDMNGNFEKMNWLLDSLGLENTVRFMNTPFTAGELQSMGWNIDKELVTAELHGSAILGQKVGAGFYQNLNGNFEPLTVDRWFIKTWGRFVGNSMEDINSQTNQDRRERVRKAFAAKPEKLAELGLTMADLKDDMALYEAMRPIYAEYAKGKFKEPTELRSAARTALGGISKPKADAANGSEKAWIREVMLEVQAKLKRRGLEYDMASIQALLWYPEKDFWSIHGATSAGGAKPTDYQAEFDRVARARGISGRRIGGALRKATSRRARGTVPGAATDSGPVSDVETYGPEERQWLLARSGTHDIRRSGIPSHRPTNSGGQGKLVGRQLKPVITAGNLWRRLGVGAPTIKQMLVVPETIRNFRTATQAAIRAHPTGHLMQALSPEQLGTSQLFLNSDSKAGLAIKGGDVVNLFSNPKSQNNFAIAPLLSAAVGQGGIRYKNFADDELGPMLAMVGFKPVARVAFDPDKAPEGMEGEPDFVYYAYDPLDFNDHNPDEAPLVQSAEEARDLQIEESLSLLPDPGPMNYRWGDDTTEDLVNERPDNPLSVKSKLAATMADNAEYAPSIVDQMRQVAKTITSTADAKLAWILNAVPTNALADYMPDNRMSSAEDWGSELHAMEGTKAEKAQVAEATAKRWNKFINGNRKQGELLGQVMHAATLAGIDPSERYYPATKKDRDKWTAAEVAEDAKRRGDYAIMKDFWKKLDPEGQEIYKQVRDDYVNFRTEMLEALEKRIDETPTADDKAKAKLKKTLRKQFEQGRQAVYFPLMRHGKDWAKATDPETGELVAYSKFEKKSERKEWMAEMEKLGYETGAGTDPKSLYERSAQVDPAFAAQVNELVGNMEGGKELQDEIHQIWLRQLPEMSVRKQFIHRKGTLGFSTDAMRNYAKYMFHGSNQLARLQHQSKMEGHLLNLLEQARGAEQRKDKHSNWAMPIYNQMIERHQAAMSPSDTNWANKATAFGFAWYLGATPAAALVNMSQTALVALPTLAARNSKNGGKGSAAIELTLVGRKMFGSMFWGDPSTKFRGDELLAFKHAERNGIFEKTQAFDLAGLTDSIGNVGSPMRRFQEIIAHMFHKAEQWNRHTTYMAGYNLARKNGLSHDAAIKDAEDVTWKSHFDYATSNRPVLLQQDVPKALFLFKNYGLNMTYRMGRDFKTMMKSQEGMDPAEKKEHTQRFVGMMMMTVVLGGVSSLPFAWAVEEMLNMALGDDDEPYDSGNAFKQYLIKDMGFSPEFANGVMRGPVDWATGMNVSDRVSLSYLAMGREVPGHLEGQALYHHYLEEMAGPLFGIGGGLLAAIEDINAGMPQRGIEKVMPKAFRDVSKAWRFYNEGALNYQQQPVLSPEAFTARDLGIQAMGFTPSKLTEQYDQANELRGMVGKLQRRRRYLMDRYAVAFRQDDKPAIKEAWDAMMTWNLAQPTLAIDYDTIQSSINGRLNRDQKALSGVVLPDNLWYLEERMRWAPKYRKGQGKPVK